MAGSAPPRHYSDACRELRDAHDRVQTLRTAAEITLRADKKDKEMAFLHIPKTAGMSLTNIMAKKDKVDVIQFLLSHGFCPNKNLVYHKNSHTTKKTSSH